ncbi:hypothetical protein CHUAL_005439 [Chamberlinius hualienensis]
MGDGGHTKSSKKLPEALRYSPPQLAKYNAEEDHLDHNSPKSHHSNHSSHNNNNNNHNSHHNDGKHIANGHVPTAPHKNDNYPSHKQSTPPHKKDTTPPHSVQPHHPHPPLKKDSPPASRHDKTPPHTNGTYPHPQHNNNHNNNNNGNIKGHHPPGGAPVKESKEFHRTESERRRAYDDYELDRRKQQMDRQGWPARDTKDYLIGGLYGPQPKSKLPNEAHPAQARQNHTNGNDHHHQESHPVTRLAQPHQPSNYQPPSHAASRAQLRKQRAAAAAKEPYRSRSFPREDRNRLNKKPVVGQRNDPRSHSLMDLKGAPQSVIPPRSRNQSRGVMDNDEFSLINEDDEDFVLEPPTQNRRRKPQATKANRYEGPIGNSEFVNNESLKNKARVCHFYKNGDPFFPGIKVSLRQGRDFASFEALCNHLTPRTDLPIGVRYIFTMDGEKIKELEEFEDGGMYVCSSRKKFVPLPYGTGQLGWKPHSKLKLDEELKLFRPPSPTGPAGNSSDGQQQPGSRGKRVLRVINNDNQTLQIRYMLNSRTSQPWENMIQGMAEALHMPNGRKLFSYTAKHIQSYSQLRNELQESDIFYLCAESDNSSPPHPSQVPNRLVGGGAGGGAGGGNPGRSRSRNKTKVSPPNHSTSSTSPTLGHVDPIRMKIKGQRREVYPPLNQRFPRDESPPDKNLELNWVYGYRGHDTHLNLSLLPTGELLYFVAAVAVLYDRSKHRQRHYTGHTEDIHCLTVHPTRELVATGQKEGKGRHSRVK